MYKLFIVVTIYEKYYTKWLLAKDPMKRCRGETNKYKLDVCMLNRDILDEHSDVELVGHALYKKSDIYRTIDNSMIIGEVGKLELVV